MNKYSDVRKRYTDTPLIDEIVYECQQILKGIIIKDEERANNAETLKSIKESDLYSSIITGTCRFDSFNYTYDLFMKIPNISSSTALKYATKQLEIPASIQPQLLELAKAKWLETYEDSNNYYRMLWGRPDYGTPDIMLGSDEMSLLPEYFDNTKYIHEYDNNEIEIMYSNGVIAELLEKYPEKTYLNYLGERSIDPYSARMCSKFGLLYMPSVDSTEVSNKFKERFDINRVYIIKTVYSEAYHYGSDYYDRFMMLMIVLQTFQDMIVYSPEYIIDRDLFDLRTIEYMFQASGVDFYSEIPLKYQKRLIKNLNRLIKYKASDKCLVDIMSLFGFNNMKLFEYYLMKRPIVNSDGSYRHDTIEDPKTGEEIEDLDANYNLQFIKVPIDGLVDDYISDPLSISKYTDITDFDTYWNGIYTKEYVKSEILKHEFSVRDSKYMSIETLYSLTEMQFQMIYFINMLLYSKIDTNDLQVEVPEISITDTFPLVDLLIFLYSLMYAYNGTKDSIIYNPIQAMDIYGFNFETDINSLATLVTNAGFTMKQVGLDTFINPKNGGIHDWAALIGVYDSNVASYKFLVKAMNKANNKYEYDIYKKVYESLFVTKLNFKYFSDQNVGGKSPATYSKFLSNKGSLLYATLQDCKSIAKDSDRQAEISRVINFVVEDIYCYLDKDKFAFIFQNIPTVSTDYIRQYLYLILNFFKSYKVDFVNTNILYKFDSRIHNKVNIIDEVLFKYIFTKTDTMNISDFFKQNININPSDTIGVLEQLYFDITIWAQKHFIDGNIDLNRCLDRIEETLITFGWKENANIKSDIISEYRHVYNKSDHVLTDDQFKDLTIHIKSISKVEIDDSLYIVAKYY